MPAAKQSCAESLKLLTGARALLLLFKKQPIANICFVLSLHQLKAIIDNTF